MSTMAAAHSSMTSLSSPSSMMTSLAPLCQLLGLERRLRVLLTVAGSVHAPGMARREIHREKREKRNQLTPFERHIRSRIDAIFNRCATKGRRQVFAGTKASQSGRATGRSRALNRRSTGASIGRRVCALARANHCAIAAYVVVVVVAGASCAKTGDRRGPPLTRRLSHCAIHRSRSAPLEPAYQGQ